MQEVIIDNKKGVVIVDGKQIPRLLLRMIQGAVGKSFVVKHYRDKRGKRKIVVTRFPEMHGVVASDQQRVRRNLFREAVVYAKWIIGDEQRKRAFRKTLPRKKRKNVYQAALQLYMRMQGDQQWLRKQLAVKSMMQSERKEMVEKNMRWSVVNGNDKWGVMQGAEMVKGCMDQRVVSAGHGFEGQGAWSVTWSKKDVPDNLPVGGMKMDVGTC